MKTLKFMLAAAMAIGLASAAQADPEDGASTGFEGMDVGTTVVSGRADDGTMNGLSYFYYDGANSEDNESVIAAAGDMTAIARPKRASKVAATRDKILQVSTGTDPLLRAFTSFSSGEPISSAFTADTYVDTLVQFTVTPYTDSVTPGSDDKLMIYLKETTNEVEGVTTYSTNLVVVAGYYSNEGTLSTKEYVVTGVNIEPNSWHRLTVRAIADVLLDDQDSNDVGSKCIGFVVYLDGSDVPCQFNSCTFDTADETSLTWFFTSKYFAELIEQSKLVLSLKGMVSGDSTLQAVGFAGEGKVDDLMITMSDPFSTLCDFTFAYDSTKVSAVSYTIGETTYDQAGEHEVPANTTVKINSIEYMDEYMADTMTVAGLSDPVEGVYTITNEDASITIAAKEAYASINGEKYDSFATAFTAAAGSASADPADHTVKLVRDLSDSTPMGTTVASGQSAVLDLNGKTITTLQGSAYWMTIAGTLVVTDSTEQASGKIESRPTNQTIFKVDGTFTMAAGTLDMTTVNPANTASGFNVKANGKAYMNGGTVLGRIASGVTNATVVVNGGTVDIVQSKNRGGVTINGGTVGAIEKSGTSEAGNIVIPALVNNELNPTQFGTNMVGDVSYDAFLSPATGYTIAKVEGSEWFMVAAAAPSGTELEPGEAKEFSAEPTAAELAEIVIVPSDAVSNALETAGATMASYTTWFEAVAVQKDGTWYAEVVPTATATNTLQQQVDGDVAYVVEAVDAENVEVDATPGFYYSLGYSATLSANLPEVGERILATGNKVTIPMPEKTTGATSGFYKVLVNIAPKTAITNVGGNAGIGGPAIGGGSAR